MHNSIQVRKAGDEVETEPGLFETDTIAYCGATLKGEFARSANFTDMHIGWAYSTTATRNNAAVRIVAPAPDSSTRYPTW